MPTIAQSLKNLMLENGVDVVWSGDPDLCIDAYLQAGGKVMHPLNKIRAVIAAARRSELFEQDGYIRACDCNGTREILHPAFKLKESENTAQEHQG